MSTPKSDIGGEFALIEWIRSVTKSTERVLVGIGDDCAVVDVGNDASVVITTDMLLEGTHFDRRKATPYQIGWKAAACSLSDVAAMGCRATAIVASVGFPDNVDMRFAKDLHSGIRAAAEACDAALVGGDVTSGRDSLAISVTAIGEDDGLGPVLRSGAEDGDVILVTGQLGGSLVGRHLAFTPRLREGYALNKDFGVHAMIDVSDGLAADLNHILDESKVGAILYEEKIPISPDAETLAKETGKSPLTHALSDGEDFELLFTMTQDEAERIRQSSEFEVAISQVGVIRAERGLLLQTVDGAREAIAPMGWDHFGKAL